MKNQKLRKVRPKRHIPSDLYPEILSRLPVKSLLRFRCVSKLWLSLVDDADFARLHLNNFKNNYEETHLLVVHDSSQNCVVRRSDTFETIPALGTVPVLGSARYLKIEWEIFGFVDGLILLTKMCCKSPNFQVWNPSIRKFLQPPSLPHSSLVYPLIGFGYDTLAKDYKVVHLVFADATAAYSGTPLSVLIYTLGANSWKTVEFQVKGGSSSSLSANLISQNPYFYFQGCLYYVSCRYDKVLVVFDLNSEVFSTIVRPKFSGKLALVDGGSSLAMFGNKPGENSIWVLETESMSWTQRYTFQLNCSQILYLKNNCDMLVLRRPSEKTAPENAKKKEIRWDQAVLYSPESDEYKVLNEKISSYYLVRSICGYVESLILHK